MFYHLLFTVCSSCYVFPSLCPAFYVSFHEKLAEFTRHGRGSINKKLPLPSPNYHCCWVYFFSVNIAVRGWSALLSYHWQWATRWHILFLFFVFLNLVRALSCQLFFSPSKKKNAAWGSAAAALKPKPSAFHVLSEKLSLGATLRISRRMHFLPPFCCCVWNSSLRAPTRTSAPSWADTCDTDHNILKHMLRLYGLKESARACDRKTMCRNEK